MSTWTLVVCLLSLVRFCRCADRQAIYSVFPLLNSGTLYPPVLE